MASVGLSRQPIVTFTTDFGEGPYVAEMKGVALQICRNALLVDVAHHVPPQDIRYAAFVLRRVVPCFPAGTVHVAVVDPGVGTARQIVCIKAGGQYLIGPDNGLLSWAVSAVGEETAEARVVENPKLWRSVVSRTFHGRDIMTPVAAHVASGVPFSEVGRPIAEWKRLAWPEPRCEDGLVRGEVLFVDAFGNLVTNIPGELAQQLSQSGKVVCDAGDVSGVPLVETYGQAPEGSLVCVVGSAELVELAVVNGNAASRLGLGVGDPVVLRVETPCSS